MQNHKNLLYLLFQNLAIAERLTSLNLQLLSLNILYNLAVNMIIQKKKKKTIVFISSKHKSALKFQYRQALIFVN